MKFGVTPGGGGKAPIIGGEVEPALMAMMNRVGDYPRFQVAREEGSRYYRVACKGMEASCHLCLRRIGDGVT